jgi:hypothetical protein
VCEGESGEDDDRGGRGVWELLSPCLVEAPAQRVEYACCECDDFVGQVCAREEIADRGAGGWGYVGWDEVGEMGCVDYL